MNKKLLNKQNLTQEKGITLIALIITIIILVILAAVSIRAVYNMSIVDYAVNGTQNYAKEAVKENKMLDSTTALIEDTLAKLNGENKGTSVTNPYKENTWGMCWIYEDGNWTSTIVPATIGNYITIGEGEDEETAIANKIETEKSAGNDYIIARVYQISETSAALVVEGTGNIGDLTDIDTYAYAWLSPDYQSYIPATKELYICDGINGIPDCAFATFGITSVTIPNSVTTIGTCAFINCTSLTNITIGEGVTTLGADTFRGCTALSSVSIEEGVTTIGGFRGCTALTSITIPDSVTSIRDSAFADCTALTSITIPVSVTSVGVSAFSGCTSLAKVYIESTATDLTLEENALSNTHADPTTIYVRNATIRDMVLEHIYGHSSITVAEGYDWVAPKN